jgi:hypothetical protein
MLRVQVAHFLKAPADHCAKLSEAGGAALPAAAQHALSSTCADIADGVCQAHPAVTDTQSSLCDKLARLQTALHPAVCSQAARAHSGTLRLELHEGSSAQALQLAATALATATGVLDIHLMATDAAWSDEVAVAALESLLDALHAASTLHVPKVTLQPNRSAEPQALQGGLLGRFSSCLRVWE